MQIKLTPPPSVNFQIANVCNQTPQFVANLTAGNFSSVEATRDICLSSKCIYDTILPVKAQIGKTAVSKDILMPL